MRYNFYTSSLRSWQAMFEAIKNAKESVYLEMYIFKDNMTFFDFLKLLTEKAKAGVRVRMILDSFGSAGLPDQEIDALRKNGGEIFFYNRLLHRMHRKTLIIDDEVVFIGGVNLSQRFRFWDDLVVSITDKRLVNTTLRSFARTYAESGGKDKLVLVHNRSGVFPSGANDIIEHFPIKKRFQLKKIYKDHIREAKKEIIIVTPYIIPKWWLVRALREAVWRGVEVTILIPKATDFFIVDRVNYFYMFKLSKFGINFYIEPKMNHAKAMLVDKERGIVGSNNLDFLSFELNSEVGVLIGEPEALKKLDDIILNWKKDAQLFDSKIYKPTIIDYILAPFIKLFVKML
jgi:cardiolipin synthase A/B